MWDFQASDAGAVWLTEDGAIGAEYGLSVPTDWTSNSDGTLNPNIEVVSVAGDGSNLLMLGSDGTLYMLSGGTVSASGELGHIIDLYYADGGIVIEMEDGSPNAPAGRQAAGRVNQNKQNRRKYHVNLGRQTQPVHPKRCD